MRYNEPHYLLAISNGILLCTAAVLTANLSIRNADYLKSLNNHAGRSWSPSHDSHLEALVQRPDAQIGDTNYNTDGSAYIWLPQDEYAGKTFFE